MQFKLCVVLLALGLSQILAVPAPTMVLTHPETNFMQFLMQSRDVANDGSHSLECLAYYTPLLNGAVEKYNTDFKLCLDEASQQVAAINDDTKDNRTVIDQTATDSCQALVDCSALTAADKYFSCYSEAGAVNAKSMFTISANASELLAYVQERVRLIEVSQYACTNKTQRTYAEDTADIYEQLSLCFAGAAIPSETSSSAAPETSSSLEPESSTESSTAAPESSTDSSSAEPESSSSAAPESSTDSSTAEPESSSSAGPESSTDSSSAEPESSSSAAPESSTDSSSAEPESSSSAAPESSTDSSSAEPESSSSAAPESSTDSSTAEPESSSSAAPDSPEEDLKLIYTGTNNKNLQEILKNLQNWFKRQ